MNAKYFVAAAFVVLSGPASSAVSFLQFNGSVQRDSALPTTFQISLPAGETSKLILGDGTMVEFSTGGTSGQPNHSLIRLMDASGKNLHSVSIPGNKFATTSFRYLICGKDVTFISSASKAPLSCPKS